MTHITVKYSQFTIRNFRYAVSSETLSNKCKQFAAMTSKETTQLRENDQQQKKNSRRQ